MSRGAGAAVLGVMVAGLALLVLWAAPSHSATGPATWQDRLDADRLRLVVLREQLAATRAERERVRADYDRSLVRFQHRLVSIYKAGGTSPVNAVISGDGSTAQVLDMADAMEVVADHDARLVDHFRAVARRIPELDRRAAKLERAIDDTRSDIEHDRRMIERARREAAAARAAARRMARIAAAPLTPRAATAESVKRHVADAADPTPTSTASEAQTQPAGYRESGIASVYSDAFAGRPTASGEPYDPAAMTAAHRTLPIGTWVAVQGPGGSVLVRINDRGPFVAGRIIDLSRAAAAAAGVAGIASVTITVQS